MTISVSSLMSAKFARVRVWLVLFVRPVPTPATCATVWLFVLARFGGPEARVLPVFCAFFGVLLGDLLCHESNFEIGTVLFCFVDF